MEKYQKLLHISFVLVLSLVLGSGCYSLKQPGSAVSESIEVTNMENAAAVHHFQRTKTVNHFILGLVSPDDAGIEELIAEEVQKQEGKGAVNVTLKYQQTFVNGLVNVLTFGIYSPFTLTVEGDVVK